MPAHAVARMSALQQLAVIQALRPDRLHNAMALFVCGALNVKSASPSAFSFSTLTEDSSCDEPVLFITSTSADPSQELRELARDHVGRDRYHEVAMGQGQAESAMQLLRQCADNGEWLCLKNLHLMVHWLPILEKQIYEVEKSRDFRLFLTTEPHEKFPAGLLECCRKITFEAPPGVKQNLQRTYDAWGQDFLGSGPPVRAQLLFSLSWFHAILQERRNYIPQGWQKFYEFSFSDLRSGADMICLRTEGGKQAPWRYLRGLLENAIYGGRIDNDIDMKVLTTYMEDTFAPETIGMGCKQKPLMGTRVMVPSNANRHTHVQLIQTLADHDDPRMFGLPPNIERCAQEAQSERVVSLLRHLNVSKVCKSGTRLEEWTKSLSPLLRHWDGLLAAHPGINPARHPHRTLSRSASWRSQASKTVLEQFPTAEGDCGRRALARISNTLGSISKALRGAEGLSACVERDGTSLHEGCVPASWHKTLRGPSDPFKYCQVVVERLEAVERLEERARASASGEEWLEAGGGGWQVNLSHWFHPGTFLSAVRQHAARRLSSAINELKMVTCWGDAALRLQASGCVCARVEGLYVRGACFDGVKLAHISQDSPMLSRMPLTTFAWVPQRIPPLHHAFVPVPLYSTTDQDEILTELQFPVADKDERNGWILAGVAAFVGSSSQIW
ncbi:unnamed protein product [Ostreobium quekettii]|uniref:Dynein heavy chain n=1 Tax=Ostreobium quekettii TaxID=121088 RepID=A0A8S1IND2_9CHLO|nr:unnamed protein product [Ostreobium quekettii]